MNKNTENKPTKKPATKRSKKVVAFSQRNDVKLAHAVWTTARGLDLNFEEVIGCCAVLLKTVSMKTGEPVETVMEELNRRMQPKASK